MRVTHLGHACLLVELADTRILVDPGSFSTGFESLRDLDAVVVTHQHADHLDEERLPALLAFNRQAPVFADPDSAATFFSDYSVARSYLVAELHMTTGSDSNLSFSGNTYYFGMRVEF